MHPPGARVLLRAPGRPLGAALPPLRPAARGAARATSARGRSPSVQAQAAAAGGGVGASRPFGRRRRHPRRRAHAAACARRPAGGGGGRCAAAAGGEVLGALARAGGAAAPDHPGAGLDGRGGAAAALRPLARGSVGEGRRAARRRALDGGRGAHRGGAAGAGAAGALAQAARPAHPVAPQDARPAAAAGRLRRVRPRARARELRGAVRRATRGAALGDPVLRRAHLRGGAAAARPRTPHLRAAAARRRRARFVARRRPPPPLSPAEVRDADQLPRNHQRARRRVPRRRRGAEGAAGGRGRRAGPTPLNRRLVLHALSRGAEDRLCRERRRRAAQPCGDACNLPLPHPPPRPRWRRAARGAESGGVVRPVLLPLAHGGLRAGSAPKGACLL
uniref:Uncharacterized protein n=1 Tax=Emiliania huxleyi (strain CCMP1516) TaxID=280463 RepID=A0A0D3J3G5_EMIH1